ncbi:MAG TPA: hypothetical protein DCM07_25110, partial [Planctomycetaceae bacterium]|nr:hypothetical protein [Planctomycetaceae bacterium]
MTKRPEYPTGIQGRFALGSPSKNSKMASGRSLCKAPVRSKSRFPFKRYFRFNTRPCMLDVLSIRSASGCPWLVRTFLAGIILLLPFLCGSPLKAQTPDASTIALAVQQQIVKAIEQSESSVVAISKIKLPKQKFQSRIPAPFGIDPNQGFSISQDPQDLNFIPNEFGSGILIPDPTKQNRILVLTNFHLTEGGPVAEH